MANMGDSSSGNSSNDTGCQAAIDAEIFDLGCLGPALAIIVLLAFLQRRKNLTLGCCSGYPGLVIPFNFLRGFTNRFTIAATFGATASTCLELFTRGQTLFHILGDTPWLRVFQGLLAVLIYGILFYPLFACLTTDNKLIGSILGFLYCAVRFSVKLATEFQCSNDNDADESGKKLYLTLIGLLPTYLCLLVVNIRFAVLLVLEIRKTGFRFFRGISERYRECSDTILIGSPGVEHVKKLLDRRGNSGTTRTDEKWYLKFVHFIYKPRADFKFSTQFISTLMVAAIVIFQLLVTFLSPFAVYKKTLTKKYCDSNDKCKDFFGVIFGSLQAAYISSWLISAVLLLHFMKCHRSHVLQLYQGKKAFYQQVEVSPTTLVERSILFSGYQVAYTIAGYIVLGLSLAVVCVILGLIVKYWNDIDQETLKNLGLTALPTVITAVVLWCFQLFLGHFVFRDRTLPKITITVNNRRLYSIISYFFFFYNVLLGLFSCLLRIFKGTVLGVLFLGRIDRTALMQGFQRWDPAFIAYLGFINVLVAHSHPVVLMFCQLLINRHNNRLFESENSLTNICSLECESSNECGSTDEKIGILSDKGSFKTYDAHYTPNLRVSRLSVTAVNRWHVAMTLLRNPSLIKYRKQRSKSSVKPLLSLGSINSDVNASA